MSILNQEEQKRVRRYYAMPKIAIACLAVAICLGAFVIVGEMINDMVFHSHTFQGWGLYFYFAVAAVYTIAFAACVIIPRFGMLREPWKQIVAKVSAAQEQKDFSRKAAAAIGTMAAGRLASYSDNQTAQNLGTAAQVAGGAMAVATAAEVSAEISGNAKKVAEAAGIELPKMGRIVAALIIVPVVVICGLYGLQFNQSSQASKANNAAAIQSYDAIVEAFEGEAEVRSGFSPHDTYMDSGYSIQAYASREKGLETFASVTIKYDGTIEQVYYSANVDIDEDKGALEKRVTEDFAKLNGCVAKITNVPAKDPDMLGTCALLPAFWEQFNQGTYYDSISMAETRDDGVRVYCSFHTDPKEKFNEYTHPSITLSCK